MDALVPGANTAPQVERYFRGTPKIAFGLFSLSCTAVLIWAWLAREYHYLKAETGLGYLLGITGASLMLVLLLYPLRKRLRFMQGWLQVKSWFRLHMMLGVLGPLCILLHCNFQLGSTNSSVALMAMLLVAGSGLIGRYFYGKFHYGLYGQQVGLQQIKADLDDFYRQMAKAPLGEEQRHLLAQVYHGSCEIIDSQSQVVSLRQLLRQRRWLRQTRRQALSTQLLAEGSTEQDLRDHYRALAGLLDKLAGLRLFERLFGLWHVVHIPVFILMIITAVVHIVVVHWY